VVRERQTRPRHPDRKPVELAHVPKKHGSTPLPVPKHIEQPESPAGINHAEAAMQARLAGTMVMQMQQPVRTVPPNPDADKIERPPLIVIVNRGPERTPVAQPGG